MVSLYIVKVKFYLLILIYSANSLRYSKHTIFFETTKIFRMIFIHRILLQRTAVLLIDQLIGVNHSHIC